MEGEFRRRGGQVGQQGPRFDVEDVHLEMLRDSAVVALGAIDLERRQGLIGDGAVFRRIGNTCQIITENRIKND